MLRLAAATTCRGAVDIGPAIVLAHVVRRNRFLVYLQSLACSRHQLQRVPAATDLPATVSVMLVKL